MEDGYQIGTPKATFILPSVLPTLPSASDFYAFCGGIKYEFVPATDAGFFSDFTYSEFNDFEPTVDVYTDNSNYVDLGDLAEVFEKHYSFQLIATLINYENLVAFNYGDQVAPLEFKIYDGCIRPEY